MHSTVSTSGEDYVESIAVIIERVREQANKFKKEAAEVKFQYAAFKENFEFNGLSSRGDNKLE